MARRAGWTISALADAFLAGGARFIQLRCKAIPSSEFLAICEDVTTRARAAGATVVVNDRADVARLAGAAGVHLGQDDLHPEAARRILGDAAVVGVSTHSLEQVRAAAALPVSYIAVGPVFVTQTKNTGYGDVGTQLVRNASALLRDEGREIPLVAIGGITLERAREVLDAGAASVAIISDLLSTRDPEARAREYLKLLDLTLKPAFPAGAAAGRGCWRDDRLYRHRGLGSLGRSLYDCHDRRHGGLPRSPSAVLGPVRHLRWR